MDAHSREEHPEPSRLRDEPEFRRLVRIVRRMRPDRHEQMRRELTIDGPSQQGQPLAATSIIAISTAESAGKRPGRMAPIRS